MMMNGGGGGVPSGGLRNGSGGTGLGGQQQDEATKEAVHAQLAERQEELRLLTDLKIELERVKALMGQVNKKEKIKKQIFGELRRLHEDRFRNPELARQAQRALATVIGEGAAGAGAGEDEGGDKGAAAMANVTNTKETAAAALGGGEPQQQRQALPMAMMPSLVKSLEGMGIPLPTSLGSASERPGGGMVLPVVALGGHAAAGEAQPLVGSGGGGGGGAAAAAAATTTAAAAIAGGVDAGGGGGSEPQSSGRKRGAEDGTPSRPVQGAVSNGQDQPDPHHHHHQDAKRVKKEAYMTPFAAGEANAMLPPNVAWVPEEERK